MRSISAVDSPKTGLAAIPRGVWALGVVSLCMDLSSELVHALLSAGEQVGAFPYDGLWLDIGRHEDYQRAIAIWEETELSVALATPH